MLYNIFKIAIQNNLIVRNPCEGVSMPKLEQPEMRVLSTEEQEIFIEYVRSERCRYYEPLFIVKEQQKKHEETLKESPVYALDFM